MSPNYLCLNVTLATVIADTNIMTKGVLVTKTAGTRTLFRLIFMLIPGMKKDALPDAVDGKQMLLEVYRK